MIRGVGVKLDRGDGLWVWLGVRPREEPRLLVGLRGLGLESSRRWLRVDRLRVELLRLRRWW